MRVSQGVFTSAKNNALVVEVVKYGSFLKMSASEHKELIPTVRQYSECSVLFPEIKKLCQEMVHILNKANKKGMLQSDLYAALKKNGQFLFDHLLTSSVKRKLCSTNLKNLIFSLDEELISMPWELMYDGSEFLCLKFSIGRQLISAESYVLPAPRQLSGILKMLILANPSNDLESAYLEGLYIKNQFDRKLNQITIDFKSTCIDTMYVKRNLRDYDIVHFAGHCEFDRDNPSNTGWVLNDGRLTKNDIMRMGESLPLPSLVFANACQSAQVSEYTIDMDYQDKTYCLASAFLFAGVRHYIGTIRKIEDAVSVSFAKEFYTQLSRRNTVGEAMRLSRLALVREFGEYSIFWTSYLLYGDPTFTLLGDGSEYPFQKSTKRPFTRKVFARLCAGVGMCGLCAGAYLWFSIVHPTDQLLFFKASQLFSQGKNSEVITLTSGLIDRNPQFLPAYQKLAGALERSGKRQEALQCYFDYLLYSQKKGDASHLAAAYIGIGWLYHQQGEYTKSLEFYNKAIQFSKERKDKLHEAEAMRKLAVWHMDKWEYDKALVLLTKSAEINRQRARVREFRYNLACDYFDLGLLFVNKDDFLTAKDFYRKSLELFKELKLQNELSDFYFNQGELYLFEKAYQQALDCYMRGLHIDEAQGNKLSLASDYTMIGEVYLEMDNLVLSEEYFKKSEALARALQAKPELAAACYDLGIVSKKKRQKNKAREYFREAQEYYRLIGVPEYEQIREELLELDNS